ncbi:glycosyltransferase [Paenibacillus anseongense]|uniref:glycosyltransferase n=1 Tax=Paenibacillus anseongense TaxID=2682845 RepID=UPI002DB84EB0|nr:glycosyltransferase [Paenibacillus anseongense]MEC0264320.1 glycosyltransferase [Paenibacillus anseongense]
MKVALLNTFDSGGAGKAALRLNKALNSNGVESRLFVKWKNIDDNYVTQITAKDVNNMLFDKLSMKYFIQNIEKGNTISSLMYPSVGFEFLKQFESYDLINLHWIPSFISIEAIEKLDSMQKPLVWTLHDENPFTGGCHYRHGCEKYKKDCDSCPQLVINPKNITKHILSSKIKNIPKNITIVTPSKWLAETARESALFKNHRIEIIANSLETEIYKPNKNSSLKKEIGLLEKTKVILFGAEDLNEKRKGLRYLLDAIEHLKQDNRIQKLLAQNELYVLAFGNSSPILDDMDIPYKALGYISDDKKLAEIYSIADVLALPSLEDNLPNMMLESLACGTPVVAFNTGGIKDIIINGLNGYSSEIGNSIELANNIKNIIFSNKDFSQNCRSYAEQYFSFEKQASEYKNLFEDMLINKSTNLYNSKEISRFSPEVAEPLMDWICDTSMEIETSYVELERVNNDLNKEKVELQQAIDLLINEKGDLNQEKLAMNDSIKQLQNDIENLQKHNENLKKQNENLQQHSENLLVELEGLQHDKLNLITQLDNLSHQKDLMTIENQILSQDKTALLIEKEQFINEVKNLQSSIENLEYNNENMSLQLESIYQSKSWKVTKPLRLLARLFKKR